METEIFTCKYFKFGRNTTGLSQSHLRNFLACSLIRVIYKDEEMVTSSRTKNLFDLSATVVLAEGLITLKRAKT